MPSRSALSSRLAHFPADFSLYGSLVRFINGFRNQNKKKNNLRRVFAQFFRSPAAITDQQSKISFLPALCGSFYFLVISALGAVSRAARKGRKRIQSRECRVNGFWAHTIELAVPAEHVSIQVSERSEVRDAQKVNECGRLERGAVRRVGHHYL